MGTILSQSKHVTDNMVEAAANALAQSLTSEEHAYGLVYPRLERIREVSARIACGVVRAAQADVSGFFLKLPPGCSKSYSCVLRRGLMQRLPCVNCQMKRCLDSSNLKCGRRGEDLLTPAPARVDFSIS